MIKNSELALISDDALDAVLAPRPAPAPRTKAVPRSRRTRRSGRAERTAGHASSQP